MSYSSNNFLTSKSIFIYQFWCITNFYLYYLCGKYNFTNFSFSQVNESPEKLQTCIFDIYANVIINASIIAAESNFCEITIISRQTLHSLSPDRCYKLRRFLIAEQWSARARVCRRFDCANSSRAAATQTSCCCCCCCFFSHNSIS